MKRYEHCTCDPSTPRGERCSRDWARCNERVRYFVELRRAKESAQLERREAK